MNFGGLLDTVRPLNYGQVAERLKAHAWKVCIGLTPYRGFESRPVRHLVPRFLNVERNAPNIPQFRGILHPHKMKLTERILIKVGVAWHSLQDTEVGVESRPYRGFELTTLRHLVSVFQHPERNGHQSRQFRGVYRASQRGLSQRIAGPAVPTRHSLQTSLIGVDVGLKRGLE